MPYAPWSRGRYRTDLLGYEEPGITQAIALFAQLAASLQKTSLADTVDSWLMVKRKSCLLPRIEL